jgi:perosamine synthetase
MIPIAKPFIGRDELNAIENTFLMGSIAQGKAVEHFEKEFAKFCGTKYAIATNSGTSALHATLASMGIGPGDEVIIPSFSFIATATSVSMCGATPVFADIEKSFYTIEPQEVERLITDKTKAVMGVHLFGHPFLHKPLDAIRKKNDLFLIEDACQAHGASVKSQMAEHRIKVGNLGDAACFSFYATKNMTTGEGGMVTTNDAALNDTIRKFINHGQSSKYVHTSLGYNYRMTDIAASMGISQLQKLTVLNSLRNKNAKFYNKHLKLDGIVKPMKVDAYHHVYHQYAIRITDECCVNRDGFMSYLAARGIATAIHYPTPIHMQPMYYQKSCSDICPMSTKVSKEIVSIPVHPLLTEANLKYICDIINTIDD